MNSRPVSLAKEAAAAYESGHFDRAIGIQRELIAASGGQPRLDQYMMLAMILFERGLFSESLDWLRRAGKIWPSDPQIAENAGVTLSRLNRWEEARDELHRAIALGSKSLNVLDCLCNCFGQLKDFPSVEVHGRRVLEEKSHASLAVGEKYPLPSEPPPRFDPTRKHENVISYGLWGDSPRYLLPLLENLKLAPHLFPGWTIRVYVDNSVPDEAIERLKKAGAELIDKSSDGEVPFYARLLWRFEVVNDKAVQRFLMPIRCSP
jgi:tetratricopeptide (TPR) repeat protein